jgi:hypothetical protein
MNLSDSDLARAIEDAERQGKELAELEKRNRKRRAKGRKPLPDPQERKDMEVLRKKYRTGDPTVLAGEDALKLYEIRKAQMQSDDDILDDEEDDVQDPPKAAPKKARAPEPPPIDPDSERAIRQAEAARRVSDMKNGRIDHTGNWTDGQRLDKGDETNLSPSSQIHDTPAEPDEPEQPASSVAFSDVKEASLHESVSSDEAKVVLHSIEYFMRDLYERLRVSFEGLEKSLSDIQGRVSEIVTATTPRPAPEPEHDDEKENEFEELLAQKTPVSFNVGGTTMTFDAITVFHAPPCITIVSKIGSAKITPKPGARLLLSYVMDGKMYTYDPVTYLGTRFDLPMFGLSFVGFIRDSEANLIDADAGVSEQETSPGA